MEIQKATIAVTTYFAQIGETRFEAIVRPENEDLDEAPHVNLRVKFPDTEDRSATEEFNYGMSLDEAKAMRKALTAAIRHLEDAEDE